MVVKLSDDKVRNNNPLVTFFQYFYDIIYMNYIFNQIVHLNKSATSRWIGGPGTSPQYYTCIKLLKYTYVYKAYGENDISTIVAIVAILATGSNFFHQHCAFFLLPKVYYFINTIN